MKEQENSPEKKKLHEMKESNILDIEFKVMVIKMLISITYRNHTKQPIKNEGCNIWNEEGMEGINSRWDEAEDQISDPQISERKKKDNQ